MKYLLLAAITMAVSVAAALRRPLLTASIRTLNRPALVGTRNQQSTGSVVISSYDQTGAWSSRAHHSRRTNSVSRTSSVELCSAVSGVSAGGPSIPATLMRGAFLRIASDLSGGTAFESVKCRVAATRENAGEALRGIVQRGGIAALWTGTPSRTVEGALVGSMFLLSSTFTKAQIKAIGGGSMIAALCGGLVGGIAQALIMTPSGLVFTSLNVNRGTPGHEHDNAISVTSHILGERGLSGMYFGFQPMAIRQASNWASRAGLTEVARSFLGLQRFGIIGEIGSGILGGLGSCWNTPIETIRVVTQRDTSVGAPVKTMGEYWNEICERDGYVGLFRGVTPRACQAIWQTCFMVVVPNLMGI